jgi:transcriptional regulator with XRE-family HTH domain
MVVKLNVALLRNLLDEYGGVSGILDAWTATSSDPDDTIDKATVHRWLTGQMPKSQERLMRLAAALDVDPLALLTITGEDIDTAVDSLLDIVQNNSSKPAPLQLLRGFLGRLKSWPPDELVLPYFKKPWFIREFTHDPHIDANFYQLMEISSLEPKAPTCRPQVFHFAFQNPGGFAARWLEYGMVVRGGRQADLWHINGYRQSTIYTDRVTPTHVETWCGPGPAIFRVASLHAFELTTAANPPGEGVLRFPG